ncbi:putative 4-hydroxy-4-methyl-2-oxoglutarate aldolase [Shewanella frigidimarina]|uniref:4-hydroxy-4-methyl-2-oxoglutarate aldolase n=2 Tax=Shewanella frigidimarina TaxID=56812 RepID=Q081K9_SHEFN|nr:putative 4-hydroxy-4-methyl-2-oxoglutarate aldolase [Shewanella frigidimarina]ABI72056.1 regulator of ribonuclease activity A [Shewanella frigidimarina NCIMB 400]KVX03260.1 ribonuclease activity regulator protein RraA [Shewanella frigidimarina]RPA33978.1 putative 4-hydroxy-4-methyl-2-oxoglutarate aldolase [Shewanella frigidimarina]|tara:strand:- start:2050 stop:2544 length:495 start_codon:yes stop_codon:yes gene_type:complete
MLDLLPDLFDHYPEQLTLLSNPWKAFGAKSIFYGEVVTVKCFEDNSKVKSELAKKGHGKVLVVDGGGSTRRALLGDMIALNACDNGWEGIIINGCIRDAGTINTMPIGVQALGTNPIKTDKKDVGEVNVTIEIAGISISPGMMIYADLNGVAVSRQALDLAILA